MQISLKREKGYLDVLRVIAIFLVVYNHTGGNAFELFLKQKEFFWYQLSIVLNIVCKAAVPIFFMISGALLLRKKESITFVLKNRVFKFVTILIVFSALQYLFLFFTKQNTSLSIKTFITLIYSSRVIIPYWYLYAYIGVLLLLPILQKLASVLEEKDFKYIIMLHFLIICVVPIINSFLGLKMNANPFLGMLGVLTNNCIYLLIGYYLDNYIKVKSIGKKKLIFYFVFSLLFIGLGYVMLKNSISMGEYNKNISSYYTSFIAIMIFITIKRMYYNKLSINFIFLFLAKYSFGIYLVESNIRYILKPMIVELNLVFNPMVASFITILLVMLIGASISKLCKWLGAKLSLFSIHLKSLFARLC